MKQWKVKNVVKLIACISAGLLINYISYAQLHTPDHPSNRSLVLAEEQYQTGNYELAKQFANCYLQQEENNTAPKENDDIDKALYYLAISSLHIGATSNTDTVVKILDNTTNPAYKQRIAHALAQYYFSHNDLNAGMGYYEKTNIENLSNDEIADEKFELAYCYFTSKQFDKAEPLLAAIKELKQGKYYVAGNYYYALLAYNDNKYADALKSFDRIKDEREYSSVVPYYIAEIYYFTGDRKKALNEAQSLIKRKDKLYYDNELRLLIAQCLFEEQQFNEAMPYFEFYYEHADKIRKEDVYEMAFCYYMANDWAKAVDKFKLLSNTEDSLGQTAMYLLGDCYLKTGDKQSARSAFGICSGLSFNKGQEESSMLLNAKLCYEMGYNTEAVKQLNNLLSVFPTSKYKDEAKTLLSELLLKTGDYAQAFTHLQEVNNKEEKYWKVQQKVAYGYAMQELKSSNSIAADSLLNLSLVHPTDITYEAAAFFWRGELAYRLHHYKNAILFSKNFLDKNTDEAGTRHVSPEATPQHAYMNMGYAAMELDSFAQSQYFFNRSQQSKNTDTPAMQLALLKEADAYFMQKDYANTLNLYNKVILTDNGNADYARFQKSILLGLQGNTSEKISLLQGLINKVPYSRYADKARYELAITYLASEQYQAAISILEPLTVSEKTRALAPKAWMKIGFAYQQMIIQDRAIDAYKHVVVDYPTSDERPAALNALKALFINNNQPAAYTDFLKENNLPSADSNSMDLTYYSAAEAQYIAGNWAKARDAFTQYLRQYPKGAFTTKAHYYLAESNWQLRDYKSAQADYEAVLQNPWSDFSEQSARRAAIICYQNKNYEAALNYYKQLRNIAMNKENLQFAYSGLMKSSYSADHYHDAISYADTLFNLSETNDDIKTDALLYKAKAQQQFNNPEDALTIYRQLENNKDGAIASEAKYHIAEYYLQKNKLKEAEKAANNTIQTPGANDYWVVKSYILLADILTKEKDYFNARATLQSIIKQTAIPELKEDANKKLEKVKALEKQQSKLSEE